MSIRVSGPRVGTPPPTFTVLCAHYLLHRDSPTIIHTYHPLQLIHCTNIHYTIVHYNSSSERREASRRESELELCLTRIESMISTSTNTHGGTYGGTHGGTYGHGTHGDGVGKVRTPLSIPVPHTPLLPSLAPSLAPASCSLSRRATEGRMKSRFRMRV